MIQELGFQCMGTHLDAGRVNKRLLKLRAVAKMDF